MRPKRIAKDQQDVHKIFSIMINRFIDPISEQSLPSISTGILANEKVTNDTVGANDLGKTAMETFISDSLGS